MASPKEVRWELESAVMVQWQMTSICSKAMGMGTERGLKSTQGIKVTDLTDYLPIWVGFKEELV